MVWKFLQYFLYGCFVPILFFTGYRKRYLENHKQFPEDAYEIFVVCLVVSAFPSLYHPLVFGTIAVLESKLIATYGSIKSAPMRWYLLYMGLLWTIPVGGLILIATPKFVSYETVARFPIIGAIVRKWHPSNLGRRGNAHISSRKPKT